jgi:cyanobactin maturation PatA/PatG family protease
MPDVTSIPGITELWSLTMGDPAVTIALLDGNVDLTHPCFEGADLSTLAPYWADPENEDFENDWELSEHGIHVASVLFGQHQGEVPGLVPLCRGLSIPLPTSNDELFSPLNLTRALDLALEAGANVIHLAPCIPTQTGQPSDFLANAVKACVESNVLLVAPAGNDGGECWCFPAALPGVLPVGALKDDGVAFKFTNWGAPYGHRGIMTYGENILGATKIGHSVRRHKGTSCAAPIITGVVGLLMSLQRLQGREPNAAEVHAALVETAHPCSPPDREDCVRWIGGELNIPGAVQWIIERGGEPTLPDPSQDQYALAVARSEARVAEKEQLRIVPPRMAEVINNPEEKLRAKEKSKKATEEADTEFARKVMTGQNDAAAPSPALPRPEPARVVAAAWQGEPGDDDGFIDDGRDGLIKHDGGADADAPVDDVTASGWGIDLAADTPVQTPPAETKPPGTEPVSSRPTSAPKQLIYAIGNLGYDFGREARRDSFKQLMPMIELDGSFVPANPHDPHQMVDYLEGSISECEALIWTLVVEQTPTYAIEPRGPFAREVYERFIMLLAGQIEPKEEQGYVDRVSIPGVLTDRKARLFSGQVIPVVETRMTRGVYGWTINSLIDAAVANVRAIAETELEEEAIRQALRGFLGKVYYDLRNTGELARERALNFAATNAFQAASTFAEAVALGMELDSIELNRSPFCRQWSDCWDVKLKFFDPENAYRGKRIHRFTIDVSDLLPVTLGEVRSWSEGT